MFCSTIIPTIGRATLARAVESVLTQECSAPLEVIVVNDGAAPLPPEPWQHAANVRIVQTGGRERCVARNTGAALARGRYFHFLDDDDVLLPGAMRAFLQSAERVPEAPWLVGAWRIVDNAGAPLDEFWPRFSGNWLPRLVSGEGLPFQASLIHERAFAQAGGFDARPRTTGVEDRELGRRLALVGDVQWVEALVAQVRVGEAGSSTNWRVIGEGDRWGRENVLVEPSTMRRLLAARPSSFWRGRLVRAYAGSAMLNWREGGPWTALGRIGQAARLSHLHALSPHFWRGVGGVAREGD